ncbi:MAG TPA: purine-nucleoside phosphorylase [Geminicoccaceae bacterium]
MDDLFEAARAAQANAHAPYSGFRVGAAVRAASGRTHAGANVENASYPEGICAETAALAAMVAAGERAVVEVLVLADGPDPVTPCGGCRQRLAEFARPEVPVHLASPRGVRRTVALGDLLPWSFRLAPGGESVPGSSSGTASAVVRRRAPHAAPRIGLILGSGLAAIADGLEDAVSIPYRDLPGFPEPSVEGHGGRLVLGALEGVPLACLQGRVHLYEGGPAAATAILPRTLMALGCETLILTNAAGSLRPEIGAGRIALIEDHINLTGRNPLVGANDEAIGPRFPDMSEVYDRTLRERALAVAGRTGLDLARGVYLATLGPCFETPAEIRAFRALGADLVGMSTVPEAIAARHCGLRVLGFSIVTNLAAGIAAGPLSHEQTLEVAARAALDLERFLRALVPEIAR